MPSIAHWRLRRLATRSIQVLLRHQDKAPFLASYELTLGVSAPAFVGGYDASRVAEPEWLVQVRQGKAAIADLHTCVRGWTVQVAMDVPEVDSGTFGDTPDVPHDVISDAERLVVLVNNHETTIGPLPYGDALRADLEPRIETAKKEWLEADAAGAAYNEKLKEVRALAETFQKHLVAFRRSLAAVIGRSHPDYQRLRASRTTEVDEDDDAVGKSLPDGEPGTPAKEDAAE